MMPVASFADMRALGWGVWVIVDVDFEATRLGRAGFSARASEAIAEAAASAPQLAAALRVSA